MDVETHLQEYLNTRVDGEEYRTQQRKHIRDFLDYVEGDIRNITTGHVTNYLMKLDNEGYSYQVVNKTYYNIKGFLDYLREFEFLEENKAEDVKISKIIDRTTKQQKHLTKGDYYALTDEELELMLENVPERPGYRNKLLIKTQVGTGVRAVELCDMKVEDVDLKNREITVNTAKKDGTRPVFFPAKLEIEMREWIDRKREAVLQPDHDYLFGTMKGNQMDRQAVNRVVKKSARNAGINEVLYVDKNGGRRWKITSHVLRHTFADRMLYPENPEDAVDLKTLAEIMGNSPEELADTYLSPRKEELRKKYRNTSRNLPIY